MTKNTVGTHDGSFHADEVSACALLILTGLVDRKGVIRSRDPKTLEKCQYVCDVGGVYDPAKGLFDHHQADYKGTLSSAGMVLAYLRDIQKISEEEYLLLQNSIIHGVDAHDNGIELYAPGVCTYSHIISNYMPIQHDASLEEVNLAFQEALEFSIQHLKRLLNRHRYIHSFKEIVQKKMNENKDYLIFDQPSPWMDCFFEMEGEKHPAQFVIMPSGEHWKLRGIPPNISEKMKVRTPLPLEWAGKRDKELQEISGINGAIFCHKGRFFSLWNTKEDALQALKIALKK